MKTDKEILIEISKFDKLLKILTDKLELLEGECSAFKLNASKLAADCEIALHQAHKWGKLKAWAKLYLDLFNMEFAEWEANNYIRIKNELLFDYKKAKKARVADKGVTLSEIKETEIKHRLKLNPQWRKIKSNICHWERYYNYIDGACYWPSNRTLGAIELYNNILHSNEKSYGTLAQLINQRRNEE